MARDLSFGNWLAIVRSRETLCKACTTLLHARAGFIKPSQSVPASSMADFVDCVLLLIMELYTELISKQKPFQRQSARVCVSVWIAVDVEFALLMYRSFT